MSLGKSRLVFLVYKGKAISGNRHANVPVSLRQVWEEVRALRDRIRARDIKGEVPQMRERESVPNTQQRFRGDLKEELKLVPWLSFD